MPKSRKRHHSRSRSRSHSRDRSRDRDDKHKKIDLHDKDRDGKRRKIDADDSPHYKRSVSSEPEIHEHKISSVTDSVGSDTTTEIPEEIDSKSMSNTEVIIKASEEAIQDNTDIKCLNTKPVVADSTIEISDDEKSDHASRNEGNSAVNLDISVLTVSKDNQESLDNSADNKIKTNTPSKTLTPKLLQKKVDSEKKRQERQKVKEEKERLRNEERERIKQEKIKKKEEKQKEMEQKQKEKEIKEELKRKEREEKEESKKKEKEQKRKEKEERDEQKRKEREQEKLKRQQEIEEKNKEKQKEEEKKLKAAAAFANFFVPRKTDIPQEEKKNSVFMAFEVKSDMKLPPLRRQPLTQSDIDSLDKCMKEQNESFSYLDGLKHTSNIRSCPKTWPYEESVDDDIAIIEEERSLGETIDDKSHLQKFRAKFLKFHENRRPAYYGTWRKSSAFILPKRPFGEDKDIFNYDEDSDDDWEEEEQGESLNGSEDEADKENEDEKDEYEVDNEFFVPHGHLSEDEIDDEENARLSPESLKQKLKLLKDEFDQDMQSKTHKLKPRSIGCIWYKKDGSNVEEAIDRYLQPLSIISFGEIVIKKRSEINILLSARKTKPLQELNSDYIPMFIKVTHGNRNKKRVIIEQFITYMANSGINIEIKKSVLLKKLQDLAKWEKCKENGPLKNKFGWFVPQHVAAKYNVNLELPNILDNEKN